MGKWLTTGFFVATLHVRRNDLQGTQHTARYVGDRLHMHMCRSTHKKRWEVFA